MARISQDQTQERRAFLLELFRSQPDISRNEAMETYKDRFGASLNAKTFNELREQALSETEARADRAEDTQTDADDADDTDAPAEEPTAAPLRVVPTVESAATSAAPAAKKPKPGKGPGAKNVFVDATQEQLQFLERVVHQLQEAGASNIRIDHGTERWMVLTVEAK
ncbi:hypothetical protein D187_005222 [Cystobacter fuscus DSM 2262]|uniref:Uncharacterized protein n=1 Tax=Cystobacter fuscus (strain ATCC 25194 / DSM 2262 / NBRC 100088 / M29) TaxID=1242864 RepID=S9QS56_CYSF2|nr:hypothetical protein [Cystobacter fuscus]EPX64089.1 hypothetical protein D187_005222 [Cystobacter fuscus DSM 2262]